tara:strand:+ start:984 stop:1571 length:588 start_codon:yes stop_codon:yes gene_type:complete
MNVEKLKKLWAHLDGALTLGTVEDSEHHFNHSPVGKGAPLTGWNHLVMGLSDGFSKVFIDYPSPYYGPGKFRGVLPNDYEPVLRVRISDRSTPEVKARFEELENLSCDNALSALKDWFWWPELLPELHRGCEHDARVCMYEIFEDLVYDFCGIDSRRHLQKVLKDQLCSCAEHERGTPGNCEECGKLKAKTSEYI